MCMLATQPSYSEIGLWVAIIVFLLPAAKVIVDWVKPPQIRPQPISVKIQEELDKQFASKEELRQHKEDVQNQMKDLRSYVHEEVHKLRDDLQRYWTSSDLARSGIHDRLNAYVEVLYELRGTLNEIREQSKKR